jgi:predicted DCC family thiol-disulfide oxidoreductase YuxK
MAVLLFDGDCAFCTSSARWLERRAISAARVLPWQRTDLAELDVTEAECEAAVQWVDGDHHSAGSDAIADYLTTSTWAWRRVGGVLRSAPVRPLAGLVYGWVARHRGRLPGGTPACAVLPRDHG